jgi:hypothetical protein
MGVEYLESVILPLGKIIANSPHNFEVYTAIQYVTLRHWCALDRQLITSLRIIVT